MLLENVNHKMTANKLESGVNGKPRKEKPIILSLEVINMDYENNMQNK